MSLVNALKNAIQTGSQQYENNNIQGCVQTYRAVAEKYRNHHGRLNYARNLHDNSKVAEDDVRYVSQMKAFMFRQAFEFIVYHQYDNTGEIAQSIQYANNNWGTNNTAVLVRYAQVFKRHLENNGRCGGTDSHLLQLEGEDNSTTIIAWMYRLTFDRIINVA